MREYTTQNGDIGHCGLTDFYPEAQKTLQELLAGDESFTFYGGSKKQPQTATVVRDEDGLFSITVHEYCDEGIDLIYDAFCEIGLTNNSEIARAFGIPEDALPSKLEELQRFVDQCEDIFTEVDITREYPVGLTIEGIKEGIDECAQEADTAIEGSFKKLVEFIRKSL